MSRKRKLAAAFVTTLAAVSTVLCSESVKNRNSRLSGHEYYLELMSTESAPRFRTVTRMDRRCFTGLLHRLRTSKTPNFFFIAWYLL